MADVSSTFSALSSTESTNSPSGSTNIGSGLDDNLRMMQSHVAALRDQTGWGGVILTSVAGTNTITATLATAGSVTFGPTALAANQRFFLTPAATNTGAATLNITSPNGGSALGAKNIFIGGAALSGGELVINAPVELLYDGTQFNIVGPTWIKGTFTITATGFTVNPTATASYSITNNVVTLFIPTILSGTSNATSMTLTGLPAAIQPATAHSAISIGVTDNGTIQNSPGRADVTVGSVINVYKDMAQNVFTNSGTKQILAGVTITYSLA